MEEYNINNIHKINSINFINITEDKLSKTKKPQYRVNQSEHIKPKNIIEYPISIQKGKGQQHSQRNVSKIPTNTRLLNTTGNDENPINYQNMDNIYIDINQKNISLPIPISSISSLQPKIKSINNRAASNNIKNNIYINRKINEPINNDFNNNTYNIPYNNNNYINNNNNNNNNKYNNINLSSEIILNNKNMIYEKQINDLKRQNKGLLNKIAFYLNDIKNKNMVINSLQQKNVSLQSELNEKNNYDNSNEQKLNDIIYKSKRLHQNNTNNINNSTDCKKDNSCEITNTKKPKTLDDKVKSASKKNIKSNHKQFFANNKDLNTNVNSNTNTNTNTNAKIRKMVEHKNNEIKLLYQKIQKMKKDIELMTIKNGNLTKLLTQKNIDLIGYQKNDMDKDKKIEQLTSLLFQKSYNNISISNKNEYLNSDNIYYDGKMNNSGISEEKKIEKFNQEINLLKNEMQNKNKKIKELNDENTEKNKKIENLVKTINELENNIKGIKSEEKQNFDDIQKYKNEIIINKEELNKMAKRINNYEEEKNNLLNDINNKEKEQIICNNKISELNNNLENYKNMLEQKNIEMNKYINDNQNLLKELKELKDKINNINNNANKEDNILLKKIEKLTNENNKLFDQINTIRTKYHSQKKLLSETNKKFENMQELQGVHRKEKKKNSIKSNLDPDKCIIIGNKKYKKLIWYLIYKKPNNKNNENDENNYDNYYWVNDLIIKNDDLKKYNKFEDENDKNKELKEYINDLQQKLEKKEESINKLDYQNKKLTKELLNKTANLKGNIVLPKHSKDINFSSSFHTNKNIENETKYKNIFEQLSQREKHLNNQINILKEQLKEKNNLETKFPHDMKHIDPNLNDSGFLDDDSEENKNDAIQNLVDGEINNNNNNNENTNKDENNNNENVNNNEINDDNANNKIEVMDMNDNLSKNEENKSNKLSSKDDPFKESEKKVDEFLMKGAGDEDDFDEIKIITKQMNFLKEEIKENREKNKNLGNEIKDLFSKIKCNDKNRKNIVQICQLLGFQPQLVDQIISNKKLKK